MHDQLTGSGAIGLSAMTYLVSTFAFVSVAGAGSRNWIFGSFSLPIIVTGILVVEMGAKLAMVVTTWAGKSVHKGMNSPFMDAMHGSSGNLRLAGAVLLSLLVAVPFLGFAGLATVIAAIVTGLVMVSIAHHYFGGVTGDVLGATNELTRMVCVVVLLAVL
jgi:adenosylcobinamide-GDP ribazoletransferase